MLPDSPRGRIEWAIRESLVILGVLLFWVAVVAAVSLVASVLALPFQLFGGRLFRPFLEFARLTSGLWAGVLPLTVVSASLYVVVRAGELLIDHYQGRSGR